jgi:hypothetical protein
MSSRTRARQRRRSPRRLLSFKIIFYDTHTHTHSHTLTHTQYAHFIAMRRY